MAAGGRGNPGVLGSALVAALLACGGCDRFYGPKFTNGYGFEVLVTVEFNNGDSASAKWPSCLTAFVGARDRVPRRVTIQRDGQTLQVLSASDLANLASEADKVHAPSDWVVDQSGVHRGSPDTCSRGT